MVIAAGKWFFGTFSIKMFKVPGDQQKINEE
jgi:hypothetical protein